MDLVETVCKGLVCGGRGLALLVGEQLLCLEPFCQVVEMKMFMMIFSSRKRLGLSMLALQHVLPLPSLPW